MTEKELKLLCTLSCAFGPSGEEDAVRDIIAKAIRPYVDTLRTDGMGNLIATKGHAEKLFISAHMDEVGFMITGICDDGKLRFSQIGGVDPSHLSSKRVQIGSSGIVGVIGARPIHLSKEKKPSLSYRDFYIDIGCTTRDEASKYVSVGDSAVFLTEFSHPYGEKHVLKGKALDNRIGCYLLCKMICSCKLSDGTFVFTVQEETGLRGATAFLKGTQFPVGIALDTTTANDIWGVQTHKAVCFLNKGAVVSFADGATIYDRDLIRSIFMHLEDQRIPVQTKTRRTGGNEASSIEKVGFCTNTISISVPCRYIHGPVGLTSVTDIENTEKALCAIVDLLKGEKYV